MESTTITSPSPEKRLVARAPRWMITGVLVAGLSAAVTYSAVGGAASGLIGSQDSGAAEDAGGPSAGAFAPPPPPSPADVLMLKLRDGTVRWGAIELPDADGFEFVRLDTSGRARLPWTMLDPEQSGALRMKFGFVDVDAEELYVDGDRLLLEGGGSVEGVIISLEGDRYLIKNGGNVQSLPKARVRARETGVKLLALDVYSRKEMYERLAVEADLDTVEGQLALAGGAESILDFAHVVEHLEAAIALATDGSSAVPESYDEQAVEGSLARARIKAENQEQLDLLRDADALRKKRLFDDAIALVRAFPEQYADSPLIEDARKVEAKLVKARDQAATDMTRRRWMYWAKKLTRTRASSGNTLEADRSWATEALSDEIQAKVHADLVAGVSEAIELDDVRTFWAQREKRRYSASTYGTAGTWLLGPERAVAGVEGARNESDENLSVADAERRAVEDRIRRYAANQRLATAGRNSQDEESDQQRFWASWSSAGKSQWLLSFYAEEGGDFELREKPALRECRNCAGRGAIEQLITGTVLRGENSGLAPCPLCHGVQVVRRIYYR